MGKIKTQLIKMTEFDELKDNICRNLEQKGKGVSKGGGKTHSDWDIFAL